MKIISITAGIILIFSILLLTLVGSCREAETAMEKETGTSSVDSGVTSQMDTTDSVIGDGRAINEDSIADDEKSMPDSTDKSANEVTETMKDSNIPLIDANRPLVTETATFALG